MPSGEERGVLRETNGLDLLTESSHRPSSDSTQHLRIAELASMSPGPELAGEKAALRQQVVESGFHDCHGKAEMLDDVG